MRVASGETAKGLYPRACLVTARLSATIDEAGKPCDGDVFRGNIVRCLLKAHESGRMSQSLITL